MRLIDAEQYRKEFLDSRDFEPMKILDLQPTVNAVPISEGATNGDMFLKTQPEAVATTIKQEGCLFNCVQLRNKKETIPFAEIYIDWWNAPYKGGEIKHELGNKRKRKRKRKTKSRS